MVRSDGSSRSRKRTLVSATGQLRDAGVGAGVGAAGKAAVAQGLLGNRLGVGAQRGDDRLGVGYLQRAVIAVVDGGHRRDVAGAEALEAGDEDPAVGRRAAAVVGALVVGAGGVAERVDQLVRAVHP